MEKFGFVGLPNAGKSSLYNALTGGGALAAPYAFATTDPNVGVAKVFDDPNWRFSYWGDTQSEMAGVQTYGARRQTLGYQGLSEIVNGEIQQPIFGIYKISFGLYRYSTAVIYNFNYSQQISGNSIDGGNPEKGI